MSAKYHQSVKKHTVEHLPWWKSEQGLIMGLVLLMVLTVAMVGMLLHRDTLLKEQSSVNAFPLLDPARALVEQKYFFSTVEPLRAQMNNIVAQYEKQGDRIGVYFEFLNTGANISINQDGRFWPASLSKMPTALAVMKKVEQGEWKLSNELVLFPEDRSDAFGILYQQPAGTRLTIERLLQELLINSDDTAHRILIRNLSASDFQGLLFALGLENLYDNKYEITAKEYSRIFRSLYSSSYLERPSSSQLLTWLTETPFNDFLASGLPTGVTFAHKIGEHDPEVTYLDSGIVYVPYRPYLITVMVDAKKGGGRDDAKKIMNALSQAAYTYVANH